jgi:hypothetical protein
MMDADGIDRVGGKFETAGKPLQGSRAMDTDAKLDYELYKKLTERTVEKLKRLIPDEDLQRNETYRCHCSFEYFLSKHPIPAERRAYLQKMDALRDAAWVSAQQGAEECAPVLLGVLSRPGLS